MDGGQAAAARRDCRGPCAFHSHPREPCGLQCFVEGDGAEAESVRGDKLAFSQAHSAASVSPSRCPRGGWWGARPRHHPPRACLGRLLWPSAARPPAAVPCPLHLSGGTCSSCWETPPRPHCSQGHPAGSAFLYRSPSPNRHTPALLLGVHSVTPTPGGFVAPNDPAHATVCNGRLEIPRVLQGPGDMNGMACSQSKMGKFPSYCVPHKCVSKTRCDITGRPGSPGGWTALPERGEHEPTILAMEANLPDRRA